MNVHNPNGSTYQILHIDKQGTEPIVHASCII